MQSHRDNTAVVAFHAPPHNKRRTDAQRETYTYYTDTYTQRNTNTYTQDTHTQRNIHTYVHTRDTHTETYTHAQETHTHRETHTQTRYTHRNTRDTYTQRQKRHKRHIHREKLHTYTQETHTHKETHTHTRHIHTGDTYTQRNIRTETTDTKTETQTQAHTLLAAKFVGQRNPPEASHFSKYVSFTACRMYPIIVHTSSGGRFLIIIARMVFPLTTSGEACFKRERGGGGLLDYCTIPWQTIGRCLKTREWGGGRFLPIIRQDCLLYLYYTNVKKKR